MKKVSKDEKNQMMTKKSQQKWRGLVIISLFFPSSGSFFIKKVLLIFDGFDVKKEQMIRKKGQTEKYDSCSLALCCSRSSEHNQKVFPFFSMVGLMFHEADLHSDAGSAQMSNYNSV